jgi:transcriptional regulator with XRE-family HTH domain
MAMVTTIPVNGALLRRLREDRKETQKDVQDMTGVGSNRITQYECERAKPTPDHLEALAKYYGVKPTILMNEEGKRLVEQSAQQLARLIGAQLSTNGAEAH